MKTKIISSDIYFVAALVATGAKIDKTKIDRSDSRHIKFTVIWPIDTYTFSSTALPTGGTTVTSTNGLEYYENLWDSGSMIVNALAYKNALQQVKTLIHSS